MVEETARALEAWRPDARVDLYSWTRHLALRIALRALFGFDPDRTTHDADLAEVFESVLGYWGREYTMQMLRGPGSPWRRMLRARALLDRVIFAEIERRRASGERGTDILSLLLDAEDEDGSHLSMRELRDQVMTLLFAGHDTTTSTVTFLFYELARKPEEIAPLLAEQDAVLDGPPSRFSWRVSCRDSTWPSTRRCACTAGLDRPAPVDRALRAPRCPRARRRARQLLLVGEPPPVRRVPAAVAIPPERFAPGERGSSEGGLRTLRRRLATCIGMRFGLLEVKAIATTLLSRFTLELAEPMRPGRSARCRRSRPGGLPMVVGGRDRAGAAQWARTMAGAWLGRGDVPLVGRDQSGMVCW